MITFPFGEIFRKGQFYAPLRIVGEVALRRMCGSFSYGLVGRIQSSRGDRFAEGHCHSVPLVAVGRDGDDGRCERVTDRRTAVEIVEIKLSLVPRSVGAFNSKILVLSTCRFATGRTFAAANLLVDAIGCFRCINPP